MTVLLQLRSLTIMQIADGIQVSVGHPNDFRSESLADSEVMRLVAILRLAADDRSRIENSHGDGG